MSCNNFKTRNASRVGLTSCFFIALQFRTEEINITKTLIQYNISKVKNKEYKLVIHCDIGIIKE